MVAKSKNGSNTKHIRSGGNTKIIMVIDIVGTW